ncbi:DUF3413 domain-containing protein [Kushneria marisflavi]|uniref:Inner membrane protein YejM N-terminal domain-containing protein n=1 Tax=Kushneria marisflavi TaxID=157779 RepID=A0A240UPL3_9GAMM|nr:DUF3413 domain-containing protein [Kushneria marisflavi]ART63013.1 hypothetical protein B9H00_08070 [Kushneria marisflavi]RKD84748.1 uncharacterized protein (TIGR04206 family) [Kushneria marisflavi]
MPRSSEDSLRFRLRATAFFALFNLMFVWLLSLRYLPMVQMPPEALGIIWLVCAWLGGFGTLAFAVWLLPALLSLFLKRRMLIWPCAVLGTLGLGAIWVDTQLFSAVGDHLVDLSGEHKPALSTAQWAITGGGLVLIALVELWLSWRIMARARRITFPVWSLVLLMPVLLMTSVGIDIASDTDQTAALHPQDSDRQALMGEPATPVPEAREAASQRDQNSGPAIDDSADPTERDTTAIPDDVEDTP